MWCNRGISCFWRSTIKTLIWRQTLPWDDLPLRQRPLPLEGQLPLPVSGPSLTLTSNTGRRCRDAGYQMSLVRIRSTVRRQSPTWTIVLRRRTCRLASNKPFESCPKSSNSAMNRQVGTKLMNDLAVFWYATVLLKRRITFTVEPSHTGHSASYVRNDTILVYCI